MWLSPVEWQAVWLSLRVAVVATLSSLPFAIGIAWLLARRQFFGKLALETLVMAPLVTPPVVTGYLLLVLFSPTGMGRGLHEMFGPRVIFGWPGASLAAAIIAFPLMVRAIRTGIESVDPKLEQAAATLGANPLRVWLTVTIPLSARAILAGALLGFGRALSEFGATITFVGNIPGETRTVPLAIFSATQRIGGDAAAFRLVVVALVIAVGTLAISEWLVRLSRRQPRFSGEGVA